MWVTTDTFGDRFLWEKKPERSINRKHWISGGRVVKIGEDFPFENLPSFIQQQQWKDAPIQVKLNISKT